MVVERRVTDLDDTVGAGQVSRQAELDPCHLGLLSDAVLGARTVSQAQQVPVTPVEFRGYGRDYFTTM